MDELIGHSIKELRKAKNMTLQDLSDKTDLSVSYLSMLERGLNSPTIANLQKICGVLGIVLPDLLMHAKNESPLIKGSQRKVIFQGENNVRYEALTNGSHALTGLAMYVLDNSVHISDIHTTDELGFIVQGELDMNLGATTYHLQEGDSLIIPANTKHSFAKTGDKECVSIWVFPSYPHNNPNVETIFPNTNHKRFLSHF